MFIIIEYSRNTYRNMRIVGEDGEPTLFGSEHTAKKYAERHCGAWAYKIVEL